MRTRPKPQVALDDDVFALLKSYCAIKRKKLSHVASNILRIRLETEHEEIESQGKMLIEREGERPEIQTIVGVLEGREPRRTLKDLQIVSKGDRYIVVKK